MKNGRFGVGIIGLQPGRSWSSIAHLPALRALADDFEVVGVVNSSLESSKAAAEVADIPQAFGTLDEMLASPDIDVVSVTVKVPDHFDAVSKVIAAGKHLYCEWALGRDLTEARELNRMAEQKGVVAVIGTQAVYAPEVRQLAKIISAGEIGEVLSTTLIGSGGSWGPEVSRANAYNADRSNSTTLLSIPFGHTFAAVLSVLGRVVEVSAMLDNRRSTTLVTDTGEVIPLTAPDQVVVQGHLDGGAVFAAHYRGGQSRGTNFLWEINGTEGDLQISAPSGHLQMAPLTLTGAFGGDSEMRPIEPADRTIIASENTRIENVAHVYAGLANDLRDATREAPTFHDAVRLHQLLAGIEESAERGCRVEIPS